MSFRLFPGELGILYRGKLLGEKYFQSTFKLGHLDRVRRGITGNKVNKKVEQ